MSTQRHRTPHALAQPLLVELQTATGRALYRVAQQHEASAGAFDVLVAHPPIQVYARHAVAIGRAGEGDTTGGQRRLLAVELQGIAAVAVGHQGVRQLAPRQHALEHEVVAEAHEVRKIHQHVAQVRQGRPRRRVFFVVLQDVAIFGNQRGLGQIDPRHHRAAVTRVRIIGKVQTECGIDQAVFTLRAFGELKLPPAVDAVARLLEMESHSGAMRHHASEQILEVAGVIAPYSIAGIAQTGPFRIRRQQQARRLDTAIGQNESHRLKAATLAGTVDELQRFEPPAASSTLERDATRVEQYRDVVRSLQLGAVTRAEVSRPAIAFDPIRQHQSRAIEAFDRRTLLGERTEDGEVVVSRIEILHGAWIVPRHILMRDRPAAVGDVVATLEIYRIQRHAPPAPDTGGTAEADATKLRRCRMRRDHRAAVDVAVRRVLLETAGFEQDYGETTAIELASQRDAGCAGADDANRRTQAFVADLLRRFDAHRSPHGRGEITV